MVRWMCGVFLKERRSTVNLNSPLGVQSLADVVRCGRLRWFGQFELKVMVCRHVVVAEVRCVGRGKGDGL